MSDAYTASGGQTVGNAVLALHLRLFYRAVCVYSLPVSRIPHFMSDMDL